MYMNLTSYHAICCFYILDEAEHDIPCPASKKLKEGKQLVTNCELTIQVVYKLVAFKFEYIVLLKGVQCLIL